MSRSYAWKRTNDAGVAFASIVAVIRVGKRGQCGSARDAGTFNLSPANRPHRELAVSCRAQRPPDIGGVRNSGFEFSWSWDAESGQSPRKSASSEPVGGSRTASLAERDCETEASLAGGDFARVLNLSWRRRLGGDEALSVAWTAPG